MNAAGPRWLGGHACAAVLTFALDGETPILAAGRRHAGNAMAMTHQQFEPRVAVPRLLALMADYGVSATFFVPGLTAERWPAMVSAVTEAGHEAAHHSYSHRAPTDLTEAEERGEFERGLAALAKLGISPAGFRAPMWAATWHTPQLVGEYGLAYDSSPMDDETPYVINTAHGPVLEVAPPWSLDNWEQYAYLPDPPIGYHVEGPAKAVAMWCAELDAMRRYHCLFVLTNHGFLSGRAGRADGLRALIEHALSRGDVSFRTAAAVCRRRGRRPVHAAADPRGVRARPGPLPGLAAPPRKDLQ